MQHQKEGKVFFILAVLIILIGHRFLQGDDFLTGAGVTKSTTTKTTETEPAEKTTTPDTATKTETTTTEKITAPTTTEKTPLAGKAAAYTETKSTTTETNQTTSTTTATLEKEVVVKEFTTKPIEEETVRKAGTITPITITKIVLENKGTTPLALLPAIKVAPFSLPDEESLRRVVREKIQAEDTLISAEEMQQRVTKKVAGIKAIEKANVKPLYIRKIYRPFETMTGQSVSDITYTGQATAGELLFPRFQDQAPTIIVPPQEQATIDLAIREPLAIEEQTVDISFSSQGQEVVSSKLSFPKSKTGTAIDLHPERHLFDLYIVINPVDMERAGENYYIELAVKKENKVAYFELLGPYTVRSTEPALFSQEFRYPAHYAGENIITTTIYQNTRRITTQEYLVDWGLEIK